MTATQTGWHRHDSGAIHRDSDSCTWLGNPAPCGPPPLVLEFPAPTTPLSINRSNGLHWAARAKLLNPWKDMAFIHARGSDARRWVKTNQGPVPISIQVDLPFRGANRRDPHNYTGTVVKAVVDGLVLARLIPDDCPEWATVPEPTISIQRDKSQTLMATVTITPKEPHNGSP